MSIRKTKAQIEVIHDEYNEQRVSYKFKDGGLANIGICTVADLKELIDSHTKLTEMCRYNAVGTESVTVEA